MKKNATRRRVQQHCWLYDNVHKFNKRKEGNKKLLLFLGIILTTAYHSTLPVLEGYGQAHLSPLSLFLMPSWGPHIDECIDKNMESIGIGCHV